MNATMNVGATLSITVIFSFVTLGLAANLPRAVDAGLTASGIPAEVAAKVAALPPTGVLFAAFLGYNPLGTLLPPDVLSQLPAAPRDLVLSKEFLPSLISVPMASGMEIAFAVSAFCCVVAAIVSWFRGAPVTAREATPEASLAVSGVRREPVPALQSGGR
jgi:hypothetical protein